MMQSLGLVSQAKGKAEKGGKWKWEKQRPARTMKYEPPETFTGKMTKASSH